MQKIINLWWWESLIYNLSDMHFCDKVKVFSVTFDPFNAPFLSKNVIKKTLLTSIVWMIQT